MAIHILKSTRNGDQYKITIPKEYVIALDVDVNPFFAMEKIDNSRILITQIVRGTNEKRQV